MGWCGECFGTFAVARDLTVGEISPVKAAVAVVSAEVGDDRWGRVVSDAVFENDFSFSEMNE